MNVNGILATVQFAIIILQIFLLVDSIVVDRREKKFLDELIRQAQKCVDEAEAQYTRNKIQPNKVAYLCKKNICQNCSSELGLCNHTLNIEHAVNFEKNGDIYFEKVKELEVDSND